METVLEYGKWLLDNWQVLLGSVTAVFAALLALALVIPGDVPDKQLQAVVDFLKRFSRK